MEDVHSMTITISDLMNEFLRPFRPEGNCYRTIGLPEDGAHPDGHDAYLEFLIVRICLIPGKVQTHYCVTVSDESHANELHDTIIVE